MRTHSALTVDQFAEYLERFPPTMLCWQRPGRGGAPTVLGGLNHRAALLDAETPLQAADQHNALAVAADWALRYMSPSPGKKMGGFDQEVLWRTAATYWYLSNHLIEVRDGRRGFEYKRGRIRLPQNGDGPLQGLAQWLKAADEVAAVDQTAALRQRIADTPPTLVTWFLHGGTAATWFCAPEEVREFVRTVSGAVLAAAPRYVPEGAETPDGHSLGMIRAYWRELLSLAMYNNVAISMGSQERATVCPEFDGNKFIEKMAESAGIPVAASAEATTLLTLDTARIRDAALTPLVRLDNGGLFVMTSSVIAANPERNILKVLQANKQGYGGIGRALGREGERTVSRLLHERMASGILCGTNLKVMKRKGHDVTDLDVVVYSPQENLVVVLQVKWRIGIDGTHESRMATVDALERLSQLENHRREVHSRTSRVIWPETWPHLYDATEWHWFVLTNDLLPAQPRGGTEIVIRSYQMLKHLLSKRASARTLIDQLTHPPIPTRCAPRWDRYHFGSLTVDVETVDLPLQQPPPFSLPELRKWPKAGRSPIRTRLRR